MAADIFTALDKDRTSQHYYNQSMKKSIPKTLLIVKNRALGDSVMTLATMQYLKDKLPNTKLLYGVPKWIAPLYDNVQTVADEIIPIDFSGPLKWSQMKSLYHQKKVDTVLELFQSGRTAIFFKLWSFFAGPKYYYHNHHLKEGKIYDQGIIKANIQRDLDAAWTFFGDEPQPPNYLNYCPKMTVKKTNEYNHAIILGVVATRKTKMWPLKSYASLAHLFEKKR